jgi:asparagine synthase (glutamine-hydrolysing)
MSAIFGLCYTDNKPVTEELDLMTTQLNHWVADVKNTWFAGNNGMGHLMLFNTPESVNEKLPFSDTDRQLTITADARIDNRDELFRLFGIIAPSQRLMADSQLILLAYKKYGEDCVKYLVGDFAFAIWDGPNHKWFCARDQMGVKSFFYYFRDNLFAFASQKKGLLCLPVNKAVNKQYFYNQSFFMHIQAADTTIYLHILKLKPAHSLSFYPATNKLTTAQYWTLDATTELKLASKDDYYEGLGHHFETAMQCRLRTNYPIGIELSGGMDSASITGVASHLLKGTGKQIYTFTNADSEESFPYTSLGVGSEVQYANEVIRFNGIDNPVWITRDIYDDPLKVIELVEKINDGLERWYLSWQLPIKKEAMDRNVRTMFSGFPGDEMATYRGDFYFMDHLDNKSYSEYFKAKSRYGFNKYKPFIPAGLEYFLHKISNLTKLNQYDVKTSALLFPFPFSNRFRRGDEAWRDSTFREKYKSHRHLLKYKLLKPQVSQRMETENNYATWFRMENRFPMADIRLTQFYLAIPNAIKSEGELTRTAWRKSVGKYLPPETLRRDSKTGIMFPYTFAPHVFENELKAFNFQVNNFTGYSEAQKEKILNLFSDNGNLMKYNILLSWLKKNVGNF